MRFAIFFSIVLLVWALMHFYVFARLADVPWISAHFTRKAWVILAVCLWASYPVARFLEHWGWDWLGLPLEYVAATWVGTLFLLLSCVLVVDVVTLAGNLLPTHAPMLRGYAACCGILMAVIAVVQGTRPPVVSEHEVALKGLPPALDGTKLVMVSDLHVGSLLGGRWLSNRVEQVLRLQPDLICLVGDLIDGNNSRVEPLVPVLQRLQAPLGVWAVSGNHEFYAGLEGSMKIFESAGFKVLRDERRELAPGLMIAGVEDLTARGQFGLSTNALEKALQERPAGATILLSHTPLKVDLAAAQRVDLMLSGHTHNGQIWPFNYLVKTRYRMVTGRHQVDGMTLIVSRGAGTWGPRMRLWQPAEILNIRLRAETPN